MLISLIELNKFCLLFSGTPRKLQICGLRAFSFAQFPKVSGWQLEVNIVIIRQFSDNLTTG